MHNIFSNEKYLEKGNRIVKVHGSPISDEEIPDLIDWSFQNIKNTEKEYLQGYRTIFTDTILNEYETRFFIELVKEIEKNSLNPNLIKADRLSNKSFNVEYVGKYYIGKIKLHGRKTYMQYLEGLNTITTVENQSLNEYISLITKWIAYLNHCNRNWQLRSYY